MTGSELEGKTALVTGAGAIGGIGFAIAQRFVEEGATVLVSGRDTVRGEAAAEALGEPARFVLADLTDAAAVTRLGEAAVDVDILVNNAAAIAPVPTLDQDLASFDALIATNIRAPYFLVQAVAEHIIARGRGGSIVNISSLSAQVGTPGWSAYAGSKSALESFTRTWAAEFGPGIRVNTLALGAVASKQFTDTMTDVAERLASANPLGRVGGAEEIAEAVLFLASDRSSYVTGAYLPADGGRGRTSPSAKYTPAS